MVSLRLLCVYSEKPEWWGSARRVLSREGSGRRRADRTSDHRVPWSRVEANRVLGEHHRLFVSFVFFCTKVRFSFIRWTPSNHINKYKINKIKIKRIKRKILLFYMCWNPHMFVWFSFIDIRWTRRLMPVNSFCKINFLKKKD